jgi:hypothetical protein
MSHATRQIAEILAELAQLHGILEAQIAEARAACANGDHDRAAAALRGMLAVTVRLRALTQEWHELARSAPGGNGGR